MKAAKYPVWKKKNNHLVVVKIFDLFFILYKGEVNSNNMFCFLPPNRARAEAEDARQKAKDDDDVGLQFWTCFLNLPYFGILGKSC